MDRLDGLAALICREQQTPVPEMSRPFEVTGL